MAYLLSIETSSPTCSVALHSDFNLIAYSELHLEKSHSSALMPLIDHLLVVSGLTKNDISAVAISQGPGSYTGLRIGTSSAKGLCYALDIPLISIDTLKSMAVTAAPLTLKEDLLVPVLDARRMEVYAEVLDSSLNTIRSPFNIIIDESSFDEYSQNLVMFGSGVTKCKDVLIREAVRYIDGVYPTAKVVGYLAHEKFEKSDFVDLAYFEPFYLKEFYTPKPPKVK